MAEPEVHFEQAQQQAKVTVERQEPQINVQRAGGQQGRQLAASDRQTLQQADRALRQAQQALGQGDVAGARRALDQADSSMRDARTQAPADERAPLQQIEQRISDARQALEREDVDAARQALEDTQEPFRLMTEAGGEPELAPPGEPVKQRQAQPGEQSEPPVALSEPAQQQAGEAQPVESPAMRAQPAASAEQRPAQPAQPEAQLAAPTEQAPTEPNPLAAMAASDVIGATVTNQEGDNVAEILDLVKPQDFDEIYAVLSVGGFLGVGDKKVVVPLKALQIGQDGEVVLANVSKDQLQQMAEYDEARYQSTAAGNASQQ